MMPVAIPVVDDPRFAVVYARDLQVGDQLVDLVDDQVRLLPPIRFAATVFDDRARAKRHILFGDRVRQLSEGEPVRIARKDGVTG